MSAGAEVPFHEIRYCKRGPVAQWLAGLGALCFGAAIFVDWYRPLFALAGALLVVPFFLRFETMVAGGELRMKVWPLWHKTVPLSEVVGVEVTIWDGQVGFFGGYSSRNTLVAAVISSWEGDRSIGNKAVVLELRSGRQRQVGTFQPTALIAALEQATGRPLQQ